ncbi:MAG: magnesium/cobalt transporter CorA [Mariniblastus sp.]|nr:magnesium/cobalt transporter CorA [Mariniblastus sp.]
MITLRRKPRKLPALKKRPSPGAAPGTFAIAPDAVKPTITVVEYDRNEVFEEEPQDVSSLTRFSKTDRVTWINIAGVGDAKTFQQIGKMFDIHRLAMEDAVNGLQRPKIERYGETIFIVARALSLDEGHVVNNQHSIFLGKNHVLSIQEKPDGNHDAVKKRIREGQGRIRESGADYLAYALLDTIIDSYFPLADEFGEQIEDLDEQLSADAKLNYMERIHDLRGDLMTLRRSVRPLRDALISLKPTTTEVLTPETQIYLRDCFDHTNQLVDLLDNYRELCSHLRDYHMSIVSNRMNEVMKVLTITGTIFIPLSFITGLYGMNFDTSLPGNMPELTLPFGYVFAILLMVSMATGMLIFIWRKGWFSSG